MGEHDVEWSPELTRGHIEQIGWCPLAQRRSTNAARRRFVLTRTPTRLEKQSNASWPAPELQHLQARRQQCDDVA